MKCRDCVSWRENVPTKSDLEIGRSDCGECSSEAFTYQDDDRKSDGLDYWDYEGYSAGFTTGPDFGCIHFKKK